jgi:hypothetical protein
VSRIIYKWHRIGGVCLTIKDLQSFESKTILSCFNVFTQTDKSVLLAKLEDILTQAQARAQEINPTEFWWSADKTPKNSSLPPIELRLQNPKLPGQDTSHYSKLSWRVQANRKVLHVKCDKKFASNIKRLMHYAKECGLVEEFWGRHTHISKVVEKGSSPSKIKRLIKVAQRHTSYQCLMMLEDINGIVYLNGMTAVKDDTTGNVIRVVSLPTLLLRYLRLSNGHQLIAEIHEANGVMGPVQAVIPNTPEVEQMIVMMNKNFPACVGNVLRDQGFDGGFLWELLKVTCCQTKLAECEQCTWDEETGTLMTQKEKVQEKTNLNLENAPWFKDAFSRLDLESGPGNKQQAPPPEALFDLDDKRSVKTIHERHVAEATRGSPPPKRKGKKNEDAIMVDSSENKDSASLPSNAGPHDQTAEGVDDTSPTSSAEDGQDESATNSR